MNCNNAATILEQDCCALCASQPTPDEGVTEGETEAAEQYIKCYHGKDGSQLEM